MAAPTHHNPFPAWVRFASLAWLIAWAITYDIYWGAWSFLYLCDLAVILTCIGLFTGNVLLISSQAVSSVLIDSFWALDVLFRLVTHRHIIGGTEYLFDAHYPLWVRGMSLFHIALPPILLAAVRRTGYDPRGFRLQAFIAAVAIFFSRFAGPSKNINFAFTGPMVNKPWGPAPLHLAFMVAGVIIVIYWPTHRLLLWWDKYSRGTPHTTPLS
jgi:hypothetical protein